MDKVNTCIAFIQLRALAWWNFLLMRIWLCKSLFDHLPPSKTRKGRNDAKFLAGSKGQAPQSSRSIESDLPQTLLETLFNVSRSHEYEPSTMNWRSMVEKMQSLGPAIDVYASSCVQDTYDNSKGKFWYFSLCDFVLVLFCFINSLHPVRTHNFNC